MAVTPSIHLVRSLARGGMGSVWVAEHRTLKTEVAVKFLQSDLLEYEGAIARFETEATAAAQIRSPHAVHVYDHGIVDDDLPYIVMELLTGEDLRTRIRRSGPLGYKDATALLVQLRRVLEKAHGLGIVHRDIKPDNVIVLSDYGDFFVKLIDFGIAKLMSNRSDLTSTGVVMGTPDYMCPEQFHDAREVGPAADWWSLAAVLFHSITGLRPFPGATLPAVIMAVENGHLSLPYESFQIGSPAIDVFFKKALNRDPALRFEGLQEMTDGWMAAIEAQGPELGLLSQSPPPADPMSITTRDDRPGRKQRGASGTVDPLHAVGTWAFPPEVRREVPEVAKASAEPEPLVVPGDNPTAGAVPSQVRKQDRAKGSRWLWAGVGGALVVGFVSFFFLRPVTAPEIGASPENAEASEQGLQAPVRVQGETAPEEESSALEDPTQAEPEMQEHQTVGEGANAPQSAPERGRHVAPGPSSASAQAAPSARPARIAPPSKPAPAPLIKDRGF